MDYPSFDIDNELEIQESMEMEMQMNENAQTFDESEYPGFEDEETGSGVLQNVQTQPESPLEVEGSAIIAAITGKPVDASLSYGSFKPKSGLTPKELAKELQEIRREIDSRNMDLKRVGGSQNTIVMITQQPFLRKDSEASSFLHSRPELNAHNRTCILDDGSRFFLRKRENFLGGRGKGSAHSAIRNDTRTIGNFLSKSMAELLKESDLLKIKSIANKERQKNEELAKERSQLFHENESEKENGLWVDKYAPKVFTQLLSPERTNREVLKAIKLWDTYVFKTKKNVPQDSFRSNEGSDAPHISSPKSVKKKKFMDEDKNDENEEITGTDSKNTHDTRPAQRVVLLAGPPGTGKTTLAHVIARHCGYRPHEVNASDDRTAEVLKDTLSRAMYGNTIFGESKPNCIILDEIDGIDGRGAIDALIQIIKAPIKSGQKGKAKSFNIALIRPLICICNDQYAPALRELKKLAQVFVFQPPSEMRLINRLKIISSLEGLHVTATSLSSLCGATGSDIRSALGTLQFAAVRIRDSIQQKQNTDSTDLKRTSDPSNSTLNVGTVLSSMISNGLKDGQRDAFQIWREIFSRKEMAASLALRAGGVEGIGSSSMSNSSSGPVSGIGSGSGSHGAAMEAMKAMSDYGDSQLIVSGLFENYLKISCNDSPMTKTCLTSDWLSYSDMLDSWTRTGADGFQVYGYIPVVAAAVHTLCAGDVRVKVAWPSADRDAHFKRQQRENILNSLVEGAQGGTSVLTSKHVIAVDVLHSLLDILHPCVRSVPYATLTLPEQKAISEVVRVLASCGLSYTVVESSGGFAFNESGEYGNEEKIELEPAITELVQYSYEKKNNDDTNKMGGVTSNSDIDSRLRKNYNNASVPQGFENDPQRPRRTHLSQELKNVIFMEHKQYMILSRGCTEQENERKEEKKNTANKLNASPNSKLNKKASSSSASSVTEINVEVEKEGEKEVDKGGEKEGEKEVLMSPPAEKVNGRMDMFFSKRPMDTTNSQDSKKKKTSNFTMFKNNSVISNNENARDAAENKKILDDNYKLKKRKVHFKFSQGFSSAVRRPVSITDFM